MAATKGSRREAKTSGFAVGRTIGVKFERGRVADGPPRTLNILMPYAEVLKLSGGLLEYFAGWLRRLHQCWGAGQTMRYARICDDMVRREAERVAIAVGGQGRL